LLDRAGGLFLQYG
jgi:TetR/AcrR family transcriptional regulator, cholesterol catabolism regulator